MKTWEQLTEAEKQSVRKREQLEYLDVILEVGLTIFGSARHAARKRYEALYQEMDDKQTPWFLGETIWNDPVLRDWIENTVENYLPDAVFLEPGEFAIRLPLESPAIQTGEEDS